MGQIKNLILVDYLDFFNILCYAILACFGLICLVWCFSVFSSLSFLLLLALVVLGGFGIHD
jgi:hypothetical protein